jgi:hypothetical protein
VLAVEEEEELEGRDFLARNRVSCGVLLRWSDEGVGGEEDEEDGGRIVGEGELEDIEISSDD